MENEVTEAHICSTGVKVVKIRLYLSLDYIYVIYVLYYYLV